MLRIFSIILVFILLAAPIGGWWLAQRSLPVTDGVITLDALSRSAVVKFDDRGIPHVEASSEKDLWMVQGYATAINRMFQMDILRRTALGELSEVFGDACLADDKLMRTIGFNRMAKEELAKLSQDVRVYLDAYSLGVNEYLQKNVKNLPLEFALLGYRPRPWMPADTVAILKYLQYEQDESWRLDDLRQRIVDRAGQDIATTVFEEALKPTAVSAQPGATLNIASILDRSLINRRIDPRFGSSAFAIAPQISDTRGAMLACDKHGELTEPDRYYLISLSCPTLHLCGATIPGVPGIIAGRNDHISWGSANTKADVQDLYLEQFSTQFPNKYRTADGWQNVTEVIEEIKVRFRKNYLHKVLVTRHGPLLVKNETTGVALNWTGFRNTSALLDASWKLNKAHDWASFTSALESYSGNPQYFVYADRKGMVGLKVAGAVPDRRKFGSGSLLLSGWTVRQEPPLMKTAELPQVVNPQDSIVVAGEQRLPGHPMIISPYRVLRERAVLSTYKKNGQRAGMPEMALLQCDQGAPLLDLVRKELHKAVEHAELIDKYQITALDALDKWDGQMTINSSAASIYESFLTTAAHRLLDPKLGADLTREYMERWPRWPVLVETVLRSRPLKWLPASERTYDTFLITTFGQALKGIRVESKKDDGQLATWGSLHKASFRHAISRYAPSLSQFSRFIFDVGPVAAGGDQDTVSSLNVVAFSNPWNFTCNTGPVVRMLVDMSDSDKLYQNLSLGESGQLISANRTDQLRPWLNFEPHAMPFSPQQLERQTQHKLILTNQ